jgi:Tol biopolymer transport system component
MSMRNVVAVAILVAALSTGCAADEAVTAAVGEGSVGASSQASAPGPGSGASDGGDAEPAWSPTSAPFALLDLKTGRRTPLADAFQRSDVSQLRVSPDGRLIAFGGEHHAFANEDGSLVVGAVDGSSLRTCGHGIALYPSWAPDGRSIVVVTPHDTVSVISVPGCRADVVARGRGTLWAPSFSPDGRTIIFTERRHHRLELRTAPVAGGPSAFLREGAFGAHSPDGTRIVYRATTYDGNDLLDMTSAAPRIAWADGSHPRRLGGSGSWMSQIDPVRLWPSWSPDGSRIVTERLYEQGIFVFDVRTGQGRKVSGDVQATWVDDHTLLVERS